MIKKSAIESINNNFSLPATGYEQDWEIELADSSRLEEFITYYNNNYLTIDEKYALMSLIVASYDDFLNIKVDYDLNIWKKIKIALYSNKILFFDIVEYWSLKNQEKDCFKVTSLMRGVSV